MRGNWEELAVTLLLLIFSSIAFLKGVFGVLFCFVSLELGRGPILNWSGSTARWVGALLIVVGSLGVAFCSRWLFDAYGRQ